MSDEFKMSDLFKKAGDFSVSGDWSKPVIPDYYTKDYTKDLELPVNPTYELIEKQEEANGLLGQIVENTAVLKELVEINRQTQLSTEELNAVLQQIYEVAKAQNAKEADSLFKKALDKINTSGETVSNISSLVSLLMGIYNTVKPMIEN